jgi:hypothetical protein
MTENVSPLPKQAPVLLPLAEASTEPSFAQVDNLSFGWSEKTRKKEAQFYVQKLSTLRGWTYVESWPLTEQGWRDAWAILGSEYSKLAVTVSSRIEQVEQRVAAARAPS